MRARMAADEHVMKCVVVLPTYNEAPNIERLLAAVLVNGPEWHALVVDDNSPDGTGDLVDGLAAKEERIRIFHRSGKLGLGTAYREGLGRALAMGGEYVCTMDSDFSHEPSVLPRLRELAEKHGVAHGSRYTSGGGTQDWGWLRKMNSFFANALTRLALGVKVRDCTSGFRCFRRDVLEQLEVSTLTARGYAVLEELLYRCTRIGVLPAEYPILFKDRAAGESKIRLRESLAGLGLLLRLMLRGWTPGSLPQDEG